MAKYSLVDQLLGNKNANSLRVKKRFLRNLLSKSIDQHSIRSGNRGPMPLCIGNQPLTTKAKPLK